MRSFAVDGRALTALTGLLLFLTPLSNGQIFSRYGSALDRLKNPKVNVAIKHPPGLNINVKRVAFGPLSGPCADELDDAITEQLVQAGIDVTDRQHMSTIIAEHHFSMSDEVDSATAIQMGRILGSAALVFVKVYSCRTEQKPFLEHGQNGRTPVIVYVSRTQAFLKGSVQVVDLTTGRVVGSSNFDYSPKRENKSAEGRVEYPSEAELKDEALKAAALQGARLFIPWSENKELVFFHDKECGLRQSADLLKAGSFDAALKTSAESLNICKSSQQKDSMVAHAYYNLGLLQMIATDYKDAIANLNEAERLKGGSIVTETLQECQRAQALASHQRRLDERASIDAAPVEGGPPAAQVRRTSSPSTAANPSPAGVEERLKTLQELYQKGLLSRTEYEAKKAQILKEL